MVKIGCFMHECKFSIFIMHDGFRHKVNRKRIKVIISLNQSSSEQKEFYDKLISLKWFLIESLDFYIIILLIRIHYIY